MKSLLRWTLIGVGFVIGSWLIAHAIGLVGVFLALAYPIWWVISPTKTVCASCRGNKGKHCRFCGGRPNATSSPQNFKSAFINAVLIFLFSVVSIGLISAEAYVLSQINLASSQKTASFVIPGQGQYRLEEIFPMRIDIVGLEVPINAVQADLSFDPTRLEAVEVSTIGSFADVFIQKEINNDNGYVRLTGGLPDPGFFDEEGLFGTVFFRAKTPGLTEVKFLPSSMVLANDGEGTDVVKEFSTASYLVLPEKLNPDGNERQMELFSSFMEQDEVLIENQLTFYADDESLIAWTNDQLDSGQSQTQVLGETTSKEKMNSGERLTFIGFLQAIDEVIINFWKEMIAAIGGIF